MVWLQRNDLRAPCRQLIRRESRAADDRAANRARVRALPAGKHAFCGLHRSQHPCLSTAPLTSLFSPPLGEHDPRLVGSCDPLPLGGALARHLAARPLHQLNGECWSRRTCDRDAAVCLDLPLRPRSRPRFRISYLELLSSDI